jgi:hypothetical protein
MCLFFLFRNDIENLDLFSTMLSVRMSVHSHPLSRSHFLSSRSRQHSSYLLCFLSHFARSSLSIRARRPMSMRSISSSKIGKKSRNIWYEVGNSIVSSVRVSLVSMRNLLLSISESRTRVENLLANSI